MPAFGLFGDTDPTMDHRERFHADDGPNEQTKATTGK